MVEDSSVIAVAMREMSKTINSLPKHEDVDVEVQIVDVDIPCQAQSIIRTPTRSHRNHQKPQQWKQRR